MESTGGIDAAGDLRGVSITGCATCPSVRVSSKRLASASVVDVVYPALIVLGCLLIAGLIHFFSRPRPSADDIALPARRLPDTRANHRVALANWHLEYGAALVDFIDRHDELGGPVSRTVEPAPLDQVDAALAVATGEHPFVEMRGELSALRASGAAMRNAAERGDTDTMAEQQRVYLAYRDAWLERLWQFPADTERLAILRQRTVPPLGDRVS